MPRGGGPRPNSGGRREGAGKPKGAWSREISPQLAEDLAAIGCTLAEIAAVCHCGETTLDERIAKDPAVAEAIVRGRAKGRATLRRYQWQAAEAGNASVLIWLGKQLLGQRDLTPAEKPLDGLSDDELAIAIAKLRAVVASVEGAGTGTGSPTRH